MPGNANAVRAGRAYYELFAENSPLKKGLKSSEGLVRRSVAATSARVLALCAAAGAAIAGAIAAVATPTAALKAFAEVGSELTDVARRTGASASALSSLGYAAKQTGSDLSGMAALMVGLRDKTIAATRGSEDAQLAFARLGIDFLALSRMKPQEQLRLVADRLKAIPNPAVKAALATELLGSADMLPTLDRLSEMEARAKRLGLVMSDTDAAAAKEFDMALTDLWETLKFLGVELGAKLAPLLQEWVEKGAQIIANVKEWVSANGSLAESAKALWSTFTAEWTAGTAALAELWEGMTTRIKHTWIDAVAEVKTAWAETLHFIGARGEATAKEVESSGLHMVDSWGEYGNNLKGGARSVGKVWGDTIDTIAARWRDLMQLMSHESPAQRNTTKAERDRERELRKNLPASPNSILQDAGLAPLTSHEKRLKQIQDERRTAHQALREQTAAAAEARAKVRADLSLGNGGAADLKPVLDLGHDGGMSPAEKSLLRNRGWRGRLRGLPGAAQQGFQTALMQVKGVSGEDVRTSSGFRAVLQSLRQTQVQNPLVALGQQQLNLQNQEARDIRQIRINSDNQKVRN